MIESKNEIISKTSERFRTFPTYFLSDRLFKIKNQKFYKFWEREKDRKKGRDRKKLNKNCLIVVVVS